MDNIQWIMEKLKNIEKQNQEITTRLNNYPSIDGQEVFITEKKLDGLGRITIPKSIRRELDIDETTRLKIFRGQNEIIIKKG